MWTLFAVCFVRAGAVSLRLKQSINTGAVNANHFNTLQTANKLNEEVPSKQYSFKCFQENMHSISNKMFHF
jgi:hypothetical protein